MKVAACVPIKLNNERTPGKNTKKFEDGTPLCKFMFRTLSQVQDIDDIYCFCSDEAIKEYLTGRVKFLQREKELDSAQTKCQDFLTSFIDKVDADIIVLAHVTCPFVKADTIADCVQKVKSKEYDSAFTAVKVQDFLWEDGKPLNFNAQEIPRSQDLPKIYKESIGCYVFTREVFLKTRRRVGLHPYVREIEKIEETDIDYPEDFEMANALYMHIVKNNSTKDKS